MCAMSITKCIQTTLFLSCNDCRLYYEQENVNKIRGKGVFQHETSTKMFKIDDWEVLHLINQPIKIVNVYMFIN